MYIKEAMSEAAMRNKNPDTESKYLFDLLLVLGLYSCDSSSMPFCLLYQSNSVRRMEGRQYSERELMELMTFRERETQAIRRLVGEASFRDTGCWINDQP